MSDSSDLDLRSAIRDEAYRAPLHLTAAALMARLEADDARRRARRPWLAALLPVAGLALVLTVVAFQLISTEPGGSGQTSPAPSRACAESPATKHGSWWVEMGGPNAFFNIEPGTRLSIGDGVWLLFTRFDPDAGSAEGVSIEALHLGSGERVDGWLNSRMDPANIYRFDEPAPSLPGGWYLFELGIASPGCWLITGSIDGRVVGSATVDVGQGRAAPTGPFDSFVPATPAATASRIVCGRLAEAPCMEAIEIVRDAHPAEVAAAWAIVVDDTCPPTVSCDRMYAFMSAVVLVPEPGSPAPPRWYLVVGSDGPERLERSDYPMPAHIDELVQALR